MPASYETLAALLVGRDRATQPFSTDDAFDHALADLDERGLVGWDRRANRYDLHPIVRGVAWSSAGEGNRQRIAERMRTHFQQTPSLAWEKVERLDDLTPSIELYVSLIRLGRFQDALYAFRWRLEAQLAWRLSASRQRLELLEMLFPDGVEQRPRLSDPDDQQLAVNLIALALESNGQPGRAVPCYRRVIRAEGERDSRSLAVYLANLADALQMAGALHAAEASACRALRIARAEFSAQGPSLELIGLLRRTRGLADGDIAFHRALRIGREALWPNRACLNALLAQSALWRGDAIKARQLADRAWKWAGMVQVEQNSIHVARLQGEAALAVGNIDRADERLHHALTRARDVKHVEEELPTLTALASLHHHRGDTASARDRLDAVWDAAERGPYPLRHADARNVLAEIESAEQNMPAAIVAATGGLPPGATARPSRTTTASGLPEPTFAPSARPSPNCRRTTPQSTSRSRTSTSSLTTRTSGPSRMRSPSNCPPSLVSRNHGS